MITFEISFLLSFPIPARNHKEERKRKAKESKHLIREPIHVDDISEFDSKNVISAAHIQYEIVPNRIKFNLDVVCWGPVARIIGTDSNTSIHLLTVVKEDRVWVPVRVEHNVGSLTVSEVRFLQSSAVNFTITNYLAKADAVLKSTKFAIKRHMIMASDGVSFQMRPTFKQVNVDSLGSDVAESQPAQIDVSRSSTKHYMKNIILQCIETSTNRPLAVLDASEDYTLFYETIENLYSGQDFNVNRLVDLVKEEEKEPINEDVASKKPIGKLKKKRHLKSSSKIAKASSRLIRKKYNSLDNVGIVTTIPGEIFFTEPSNMTTYHLASNKKFVRDVYIFVSAQNILTRAQKLLLKPLVVKLFRIDNFPSTALREQGYEHVYACYNIPDVVSYKTAEYPIQETICFNESHIHFLNNVPSMKLVEAIQTKRFYVDIYSPPIPKEESARCRRFGEDSEDFKFSRRAPSFKRFVEPDAELMPVLLAVCSFDISSLTDNVWDFREMGQCHAPDLVISTKGNYEELVFSASENINEIHLKHQSYGERVISEATFLELGTTVSVDIYLMAPQVPSNVYYHASTSNTFKRIFFVIEDDEEFALDIYKEIFFYNEPLLENIAKEQEEPAKTPGIVTGFVLDNGNGFFFYVEGASSNTFIMNLWHKLDSYCQVSNLEQSLPCNLRKGTNCPRTKVFFNTDNVFQSRLYDQFVAVGMYVINLKIPFQNILSIPKLYCRKMVPRPCLQALTKLCLLFHSNGYKTILQQNLLPSAQELISLNVEWGVPNRWLPNPTIM